MKENLKHYRANRPCRVGGIYRKAGDTFYLPPFASIPSYLEELESLAEDEELESLAEDEELESLAEEKKLEEKSKTSATKKQGSKQKKASIPQKVQVGEKDIGGGTPTPASEVNSFDMIQNA